MLICLLQDTFQATIHCIDCLHSEVNSMLSCFFVFDYNVSYYNTLKMGLLTLKELFVFVLLSFFITLINLGAQTLYTVVNLASINPWQLVLFVKMKNVNQKTTYKLIKLSRIVTVKNVFNENIYSTQKLGCFS